MKQEVVVGTADSFAALRQPGHIPQARQIVDLSGDSPLAQHRMSESSKIDRGGAEYGTVETPQIKIYAHSGGMKLRVDHEVRNVLMELQKSLSEFVSENMRGPIVMGFRVPARDPVEMDDLIKDLKSKHELLEKISVGRGDGFGPSLIVRQVATEAAYLLEHTVIGFVASVRDGSLSETEVEGVMHELTDLKHGLRQLTQQFDGAMLQFVQESGALEQVLAGGKKEKGSEK